MQNKSPLDTCTCGGCSYYSGLSGRSVAERTTVWSVNLFHVVTTFAVYPMNSLHSVTSQSVWSLPGANMARTHCFCACVRASDSGELQ